MNTNLEKINQQAEYNFISRKYFEAIDLYSEILSIDSTNKEAKVGVLLSDMALDQENEAQSLFEYYQLMKKEKQDNAEELIDDILKKFDGNMEKINTMFKNITNNNIEQIPGILYQDFKKLTNERGGFKRTFEDLMYSTRIIITEKKDFLEFIESLIDYGYNDIAMKYLEEVSDALKYDKKAIELLKKVVAKPNTLQH